LAALSSCLARALYSSMVREKAVSEAEREPRAAGVRACGCCCGSPGKGLERAERSLRMVVRCFSAELKVVFCRREGQGMFEGRRASWLACAGSPF
jgi:hypothetical protein